MDLMNAIPKYFEEISRDVQYLTRVKDGDRERFYLVVSVALRALGGYLAFNTTRCVVAALINPLTLIGSLSSAIVAFVLARDFLVVGNGMRVLFEKREFPATNEFFIWDMGKGDGMVPGFHDTIIIKPAYLLWVRVRALLQSAPLPPQDTAPIKD